VTNTLTVTGLITEASNLIADWSSVIGAASVIGLGRILLGGLIRAAR